MLTRMISSSTFVLCSTHPLVKKGRWGIRYKRSYWALISRLLGILSLRNAQTIERTTAWVAVSSLVQAPSIRFYS